MPPIQIKELTDECTSFPDPANLQNHYKFLKSYLPQSQISARVPMIYFAIHLQLENVKSKIWKLRNELARSEVIITLYTHHCSKEIP